MDNELQSPEMGQENELKEEELKEAAGGRTPFQVILACPVCHTTAHVRRLFGGYLFYCTECKKGYDI